MGFSIIHQEFQKKNLLIPKAKKYKPEENDNNKKESLKSNNKDTKIIRTPLDLGIEQGLVQE